jgi:hypothetical protein
MNYEKENEEEGGKKYLFRILLTHCVNTLEQRRISIRWHLVKESEKHNDRVRPSTRHLLQERMALIYGSEGNETKR